jgi:hypothetical protein
MLAAIIVCHTVGDDSCAKGGHGGSKGGKNSAKGSAGTAPQNHDKCKLNDPRAVADFQLRLEKWKLKMRMEVVERLREKAERTGNDKLRERADALEKWAQEHFHQRVNQIMEFRRKHGLPDIKHHMAVDGQTPS